MLTTHKHPPLPKKLPTMVDEGEAKKKRVVLESLGWLTESSIIPKKHRAIEGVGASSILELKAQLYKSQEESKRDRVSRDPIYSSFSSDHQHLDVHRAKKKITAHDPFSVKNSGVEARAAKLGKGFFFELV